TMTSLRATTDIGRCMAMMPDKTELLELLRNSGDDAVRQLRALPEAAFAEGRYENGWNGKQILAHIASIEWTYRRLIEVAQQADAPGTGAASAVRRTTAEETPGLPTRAAAGGIDAYNARQVEKRADASPAELIDEFARNRALTIGAVRAADEALFGAEIRSAGGITGSLGGVLRAVAVEHVRGHVADIAGRPAAGTV
ncbi:MAG TPA: DinB family protein, partial [Dehalococcoidia bacterium]